MSLAAFTETARPPHSQTGRIGAYHARWLWPDARHSAPRIALLHGFTGSSADWLDCAPNLPAVALDLAGHGGSAPPTGDWAAEIARLLTHLPASIEHLSGYSLGARVVLGLLVAAPTRFATATVIGAHPGLISQAARARRRIADARWQQCLREQGLAAFVAAWEAQPLFASQQHLPAERLAAQRARRLTQDAAGLAACLDCLGLGAMPPTWRALVGYRGRLRWICGQEDRRCMRLALRLRRLRPATELWPISDCGHNPLLEAPAALRQRLIDQCAHGAAASILTS